MIFILIFDFSYLVTLFILFSCLQYEETIARISFLCWKNVLMYPLDKKEDRTDPVRNKF